MFKKFALVITFIMLVASFATVGCVFGVRGSGNVVSENRSVSDFDRIELDGIGEIILTQGETESLTVEAEDNLMQYIKTTVRGDTLYLNLKSNRPIVPTDPIIFYVTVTNLESVSVDGAGEVSAERLNVDSLELSIDGTGHITIDQITANRVVADINGMGLLYLTGTVNEQEINIDGSGNYEAADLESQVTTIEIDGLGSASVNVQTTLDVNIDGSGQVEYFGNPTITQDINGLGRIVEG